MTETKLACYTAPWGLDGLIKAISDISECGFVGIECPAIIVQQYEDRLHVFEEILQSLRLKLSGLLQPLNLMDCEHADEQVERAANSARFASAAGANCLTICHVAPFLEEVTDDTWATFSAVVEEIGHRCSEFDIDLCFMPRAGHLVGTEKDIHRFLASTKPACVKLAVDTAEIVLAGGSPPRVIRDHAERIRSIRYRDVSASKRRAKTTSIKPGTAPQFGRGAVDFEAVSKSLLAAGYGGWIILDVTGEAHSPAEAVLSGHRFLMRKSGLFPEI